MVQAVAVAVPSGVNPAGAIPNDADVTMHSRHASPGADAGIAPVPPAAAQVPGFLNEQPKPAAPNPAADPEYAAFLQWKAQQAAAKPAQAAPAVQAPVAASAPIGAQAALDAAKAATAQDPHLMAVFSTFELVAPEVDLARAVGAAIDHGDLSRIDEAYLREKGGANAEKLIQIAKGLIQHINTSVTAVVTSVHAMAGGEDAFNNAVAVFNEKAPKYLREFVAQSFDSHNPDRIRSATESLLDFVKTQGALPVAPQGHVRAGGGTPAAGQGLSKEAYQAERLKLNRNDRDYADKERELTARRQIGKSQGL